MQIWLDNVKREDCDKLLSSRHVLIDQQLKKTITRENVEGHGAKVKQHIWESIS